MSFTDPRTWVTDEIVSSSQLNTHVRDNQLSTAHIFSTRGYTTQGPRNTVSETSLYSSALLVPGGSMGASGSLEAFLVGQAEVGAGSSQATLRVKFGGSTVVSSTLTDGVNAGIPGVFRLNVWVENLGSVSSQRVIVEHYTTAGRMTGFIASATSAVNTASDQSLDVTCQWTVASASNYLESYFRKQTIAQN